MCVVNICNCYLASRFTPSDNSAEFIPLIFTPENLAYILFCSDWRKIIHVINIYNFSLSKRLPDNKTKRQGS